MESVGGYRLVRKLGDGERAEVFLGHAGPDETAGPHRVAAIKVYRQATMLASIDEEIEALARASSRHLVELRDLSTGGDGRPCLIFERHDADPLSRLFGERSSIEAGELVTALAPIASAVAELHRVGVAHGNVRLSSVLLDRHGAPILAGFGHARLVSDFPAEDAASLSPAAFALQPLVLADLRDLVAMVAGVLERVRGDSAADIDRLRSQLDQLDGAVDPHLLAGELADHLFALAPAQPIASRATGRGADRSALGVIPARAFLAPAADPLDRQSPGDRVVTARGSARQALSSALARVRALCAPVRRSFWIVGAIGVAAIVGTIIVVPTASGAAQVERTPTTAPHSPTPSRSASAPAETGGAAVSGTDPLAAAQRLLSARAACLGEKSISCLDGVDQKDSAAMDLDRQGIRESSRAAKTAAEASARSTITLVQQLGDSAILALAPPAEGGHSGAGDTAATPSTPASLLIVRGEAGWRIRDLVLP